ncbi:hypothetical protein COEX109129_16715 [Corallococcus exiguus]
MAGHRVRIHFRAVPVRQRTCCAGAVPAVLSLQPLPLQVGGKEPPGGLLLPLRPRGPGAVPPARRTHGGLRFVQPLGRCREGAHRPAGVRGAAARLPEEARDGCQDGAGLRVELPRPAPLAHHLRSRQASARQARRCLPRRAGAPSQRPRSLYRQHRPHPALAWTTHRGQHPAWPARHLLGDRHPGAAQVPAPHPPTGALVAVPLLQPEREARLDGGPLHVHRGARRALRTPRPHRAVRLLAAGGLPAGVRMPFTSTSPTASCPTS